MTRHRPEIPEADRLREPHRRGQSRCWRSQAARGLSGAVPSRSAAEARAHRRDPRHRSGSATSATCCAANLSHGQKQWLEIGMLLAQDPKLLLVDEPVAGMTDAETEETARLLKDIASDAVGRRGRARHGISCARSASRSPCLHEGSVLSEGTLDHVSADPGHRSLSGAMTTSMIVATPNPLTRSSSGSTGRTRFNTHSLR